MIVVEQSAKWEQELPEDALEIIERAGRTCYKSEARITDTSAEKFVRGIVASGHHSVLEHVGASVRFITDRGVSHEIVRHRIASYSQESTRYCNYGKADDITFIKPVFFEPNTLQWNLWKYACENSEDRYLELLKSGATPQEARTVLNNSLKTELVMTANLREWRYFFTLRCSKAAHPQMRALALDTLELFKVKHPVLVEDIVRVLGEK